MIGVLAALWLIAPAAGAQTDRPLPCPDSGVVVLSIDSAGQRLLREIGSSVDTTYIISVNEERRTWLNRTASVAVGVRGIQPASWHACAGAWASLRQATLILENAQGQVHVRASLEPLLAALRMRDSPPRENPRGENR